MQHLRNLTKYTPDDAYNLFLMDEHNAEFFISDDGRDWYESQADFMPDTLKVAYDEAGIIRCISKDVSSIYPRDFSVVEVEITPENQDVDIMGGWVFKDGKIQPREYSQEELIARAEEKKTELLAIADAAIAPLSRAVRLKMATDEEAGKLEEWERYSVYLNRVDTSSAPDINWPEKPE
ncbi:tail fiber assembly protein [Citrobacter koseri]|uniref:tail fiber assembly protein n=2 Tax=Citrobacter koseri TaxID=545 RepID=UPI0023B19E13|nr:tail fiber assembly protein [Citrobacter koseri]EKW1004429.1 tail fiber assembly protein [Citrobacter koseri]ELG4624013.1 tail fiber assembly protein [Citrobacter koseri]